MNKFRDKVIEEQQNGLNEDKKLAQDILKDKAGWMSSDERDKVMVDYENNMDKIGNILKDDSAR